MSLPRFHIPPEQWNETPLCLNGDEAKHCTQVLRRGIGEEIVVFNGVGEHARARITGKSNSRVEIEVIERFETPRHKTPITLVQAIPKGSNMEFIVEKTVELGVSEIFPVLTERTVVRLETKEAAKKRDKWQRVVLEACKQCGQNWMPTVHAPQALHEFWKTHPQRGLRLIAAIQPDARCLKTILAEEKLSIETAAIFIGPEGDFTPEEYAVAREQGCKPLSLGSIILRVETAAMYCLSILAHELRS